MSSVNPYSGCSVVDKHCLTFWPKTTPLWSNKIENTESNGKG